MIEDFIGDNGGMIRVWHYAHAPQELRDLAPDPDFVLCVVMPVKIDGDDWDESFSTMLEYGYIHPTRIQRGDFVIYYTYH